MKKFLTLIIIIFLSFLTACGNQSTQPDQNQSDASTKDIKQWDSPPEMKIDQSKQYQAVISTNKGDITIELFAKDAPITVNNFIFLAEEQFYDNVIFHRVMKDFMIQTGDPLGNGTGSPGYTFEDELPSKYKYEKGIVAMANRGPNTNGSQFFICNGSDSESLNQNPNYTIFGKVVDGMDVVEKISNVEVERSVSGEKSSPVEKVYIKTVTINNK